MSVNKFCVHGNKERMRKQAAQETLVSRRKPWSVISIV